MEKTQSDLIPDVNSKTNSFRIMSDTRQIAKTKSGNKEVREDWRNRGESGRGGFGVVYKQTQETTGHYRAVKAIDKRMHSKIHYSRVLFVMAILANVCVLTSKGNYSACSLPPYGTLPLSNGWFF